MRSADRVSGAAAGELVGSAVGSAQTNPWQTNARAGRPAARRPRSSSTPRSSAPSPTANTVPAGAAARATRSSAAGPVPTTATWTGPVSGLLGGGQPVPGRAGESAEQRQHPAELAIGDGAVRAVSPVSAACVSSARASRGRAGRGGAVGDVARPEDQPLGVVGGVEEAARRIGEAAQGEVEQVARDGRATAARRVAWCSASSPSARSA